MLNRLRKKNFQYWLRDYGRHLIRRARAPHATGPRHILFALCDHYEPLWGHAPDDVGVKRVDAWAERYPALVTRMANEGHLVGHHSWTHTEPAATSAAVLLDEVRRSCALVQQLTGKNPDRFRPPKGQLTAAKILGLLGARQRVILWSQDPKDYQMNDAAPLVQWSTTAQLHGGDIVLLHDVRPHVLAALPALVTRAAICGEPLVTLDAWLPAQRSAA